MLGRYMSQGAHNPKVVSFYPLVTDEATEVLGGLGTCSLSPKARPSSRPADCKGTWNHGPPLFPLALHDRQPRETVSQAAYFYWRELRPPMPTPGSDQTTS